MKWCNTVFYCFSNSTNVNNNRAVHNYSFNMFNNSMTHVVVLLANFLRKKEKLHRLSWWLPAAGVENEHR